MQAATIALRYREYVDTFAISGILPPMMHLKRVHTDKVVENALLVSRGEGFDAHIVSLCEIAAWLHDTGRYEQFKRFNTFRDSDSVDHAVFSHDIVVERGWLDDTVSGADREAVLKAVLYHNRRELPDGLDSLTDTVAKVTRDADKLDIFRVLEERIETTDWRKDATAFWNLRYDLKPSSEVKDAIRDGRPVDYQSIRSLADFILIQVGWIVNGLYFATSRSLARARGHFEYRRRFLLDLVDYDIADIFGEGVV